MVLHNPNNWHWVDKQVTPWTRKWFDENLLKLEAEEGDVKARISKVQSMDGDVEVSQRRGKVMTLYDVKLVLEYSGSAPDADDVSGTITVPEVATNMEQDEYVFNIDIVAHSKEKEPVKELVRTKLIPLLRQEFDRLSPVLVAEHGKDIQHAPGSDPSSGVSTPKLYTDPNRETKAAPVAKAPVATPKSNASTVVNTTKLTDNEEFRTSAEELYQTFTDPQRIAAFTRSPPTLFEGAKQGGKFALFGGNVSGEYVELEKDKKIVQKWRLAQWPASHFSTLQIEFDQNNVDHVTVMRVSWTGVPVGQEEVTKRNWQEYYVRSIKITFGFGTIL